MALDEQRVAQIVRQIVDAVAYCHDRSVAHRDLKLENLMFGSNGEEPTIKLIDFGFCKVFEGDSGMYAVLGSPYYVAPEVLQARSPSSSSGGRGYGSAADMWSVGVITFMVLCGNAPFDGQTDTERLNAVRKGVFAYPPQATLSPEAAGFINAMLEMDPKRRLTARQALNHPWLKTTVGKVGSGSSLANWIYASWG